MNRMNLNVREYLLPVMIVGGWLVAVGALAQLVPPLINYQGRLANPDGSPFPTADYELRVAIYDAATNGSSVWGPQMFDGAPGTGHGPRLPVVQGFFNVMLGPVDTHGRSILDAFGASSRFVEVTVSNRLPILPRQQILPAPFAIQAANGVPPGTISAYMGTHIPAGWLLCDGREVARSVYAELHRAIGNSSGAGNGTTSFRLPDLRGMFLRGNDGASGRDPGSADRVPVAPGGNTGPELGTAQSSATSAMGLEVQAQNIYFDTENDRGGFEASYNTIKTGGYFNRSARPNPFYNQQLKIVGGVETRPVNVSVNYIIKH